MRCEVIAIGTELLLGQIVDSNSSWIGEQLALIGIDSLYQVKVGDNFGRMEATIRQALERSDAVICCGGLGPTQDDITREMIAEMMGVELELRDDLADKIRAMFESRGRTMPENNLRQAMVPVGATTMEQLAENLAPFVDGAALDIDEEVLAADLPRLTAIYRDILERLLVQGEAG